MMQREPKSEPFSMQMTREERLLLERLAEERGATLSGVIRKLLRDAGKSVDPDRETRREERHQ